MAIRKLELSDGQASAHAGSRRRLAADSGCPGADPQSTRTMSPARHWIYSRRRTRSRQWAPASELLVHDQEDVAAGQQDLFAEEERDDLELVNRLREDVSAGASRSIAGPQRSRGTAGVLDATRSAAADVLLPDRSRRDAHLPARAGIPGRLAATGFKKFEVDAGLCDAASGDKPALLPRTNELATAGRSDRQSRRGAPSASWLQDGHRLRQDGRDGHAHHVGLPQPRTQPREHEFPNAVLICAPNLTVKERLQVLRPEHPWN